MERLQRLVGLALAAALLALLPALAGAQSTPSISGLISYRERIALPADAIVTIQIAEVTAAGVAGRVVAEQTFATAGAQVPFRFTLFYSAAQISPGQVYTLQGSIRAGGRALFRSAAIVPVITGGAPSANLDVVMVAVSGDSLPSAGSELWLIGLALLLLAGAGAVHLLRRRVVRRG